MSLIDEWNALEKDEETDVVARENDIVEYIDGVYFLCERTRCYNNVVCISTEEPSLKHIRAMFKFCIHLYEKYGIVYIRIEGSRDRYNFLLNTFSIREVVPDINIRDRNVFYCNLELAIEKLHKLAKI